MKGACSDLFDMLKTNSTLEKLILRLAIPFHIIFHRSPEQMNTFKTDNNDLENEEFRIIFEALKSNSSLTKLVSCLMNLKIIYHKKDNN